MVVFGFRVFGCYGVGVEVGFLIFDFWYFFCLYLNLGFLGVVVEVLLVRVLDVFFFFFGILLVFSYVGLGGLCLEKIYKIFVFYLVVVFYFGV